MIWHSKAVPPKTLLTMLSPPGPSGFEFLKRIGVRKQSAHEKWIGISDEGTNFDDLAREGPQFLKTAFDFERHSVE